MEPTNSHIVRCTHCGKKNRIASNKRSIAAKCGSCGSPLNIERSRKDSAGSFLVRCTECWTRNRVPSDKISSGVKCGKCGSALKTDALFVGEPVMITDGNFETEVLKSPLPVLLFAWAPWCSTCRTFIPVIDDFAKDSKGKVRVGKINVDANPALSSKFNILSVPFVFIFDTAQLKESMPGAMYKHEIMKKMAPYL